jgi:hypothetical protein
MAQAIFFVSGFSLCFQAEPQANRAQERNRETRSARRKTALTFDLNWLRSGYNGFDLRNPF